MESTLNQQATASIMTETCQLSEQLNQLSLGVKHGTNDKDVEMITETPITIKIGGSWYVKIRGDKILTTGVHDIPVVGEGPAITQLRQNFEYVSYPSSPWVLWLGLSESTRIGFGASVCKLDDDEQICYVDISSKKVVKQPIGMNIPPKYIPLIADALKEIWVISEVVCGPLYFEGPSGYVTQLCSYLIGELGKIIGLGSPLTTERPKLSDKGVTVHSTNFANSSFLCLPIHQGFANKKDAMVAINKVLSGGSDELWKKLNAEIDDDEMHTTCLTTLGFK